MEYVITDGGFAYTGYTSALTGDVVLPEGITSVYNMTGCEYMTSVVIPEGVTEIDHWAFHHCTCLERVTLPSTLEVIGKYAFGQCDSLKTIFIPQNARLADLNVFDESGLQEIVVHEDNPYYCSIDGVLYSKDMKELLLFPPKKCCEEYIVERSTERIDGAFNNCTEVRRVVIPHAVKSVEVCAFWGSIEEVRFLTALDGVASLEAAFSGFEGKRIIAPEIEIMNFSLTKLKSLAAAGYAKAYFSGRMTGSFANKLYEEYISDNRLPLGRMAAEDIWLMRYMTERQLISAEDIDGIMSCIYDGDVEIRALLLEYSRTLRENGKMQSEELEL